MDYLLKSVFIRLFYGDIELSEYVQDLKYTASEEEDDECSINIRSSDRSIVDQPQFQEKAQLKVVWGFVGGTEIATRIIIIEDIQWTYDKENITGNIIGTEKGAKIKFSSSDTVYQNTSMLGVAKEIADKHGLKLEVELPSKEDKDKKKLTATEALGNLLDLGEKISLAGGIGAYEVGASPTIIITDDLKKEWERRALEKRQIDTLSRELYGKPYSQIKDQFEAVGDGTTGSLTGIQNKINFYRWIKDMKLYPFLAQGNKTDKQLLTELGMKEKDGPFFAETRDDRMVIRRRNWNKTPYKSYEYGGAQGLFLEFSSDPKNRNRKGSALNMAFGHWNALNKTYLEGNTNAINDTSRASLAKFEELYENYKILAEKYPDAIVGYKDITKEVGSNKGFLSSNIIGSGTAISDETRVVREIRIPLYAIDKVKVLEQTLNEIKGITPNKKMVDSNNDGIEDAYDQASNLRNQSELKRNPFTAKFYGDTGLWPGEILTLLKLGDKYSGNYYLTKADHIVSKSAGYIVSVDMVRRGGNIQSSDTHVSTKGIGKVVNTKVGSDSNQQQTKTIDIKQNQR